MTSQATSGNFAKVSNLTEQKNFTIVLRSLWLLIVIRSGVNRAVDLETDFLRSRSWSRIFRAGLGLFLEPWWSRSRSLKLVSRPSYFCE